MVECRKERKEEDVEFSFDRISKRHLSYNTCDRNLSSKAGYLNHVKSHAVR